jgi:hypothetical protein
MKEKENKKIALFYKIIQTSEINFHRFVFTFAASLQFKK